MVFSSPVFLFLFLPISLLLYYSSPQSLKNTVLLLISLLFYAWGEVFYMGVMIASIFSNYGIGRLISNARKMATKHILLAAGISVNVGLLISFKYANFITDNLNTVFSLFAVPQIDLDPIHLPLGISFFTFQAISYIVDVHQHKSKAQNNPFDLALYISLFPQLIAGPIVRYHDISFQIIERSHSMDLFASGAQRFIFGLAKKMWIANPLGEIADNAFALSGNGLSMPLAWLGILSYALQIYFDFSGYSDMAIGLGRMFGFRFHENFNYPYIARSVREFWRRWHISLSTWFKDYVYIPMGGSRNAALRTYFNLLVVFFLTGIWHGANWNFVAWGMFHGFFITIEHIGFSRFLEKLWTPIQHIYLALIILVSWVFFRADTLDSAIEYYGAMVSVGNWHTSTLQYEQVMSNESLYILGAGLLLSLPIYTKLKHFLVISFANHKTSLASLLCITRLSFLSFLILLSFLKVAASTYNPFIYFRF
ncbi:MAG: MBOAT family protein [Desulfatitalea sp.]|nr:MBOAT family protein [Desulfatitalea sp.]NNK00130.1 MBOAT family protein [Desulfatitalea sp.]